MSRYELYGWKSEFLEDGAQVLSSVLGGRAEPHDSLYLGEYYHVLVQGIDELTVQPNLEDDEGYLIEPDFAEYQTLVYVTGATDEHREAIKRIGGLDLLRQDD
jgi:hypothetical protein